MKKLSKRQLLIPAALIVGAGCSPAPKVCGSETFHACWPDGGFACGEDCGALKLPDGGLELNSMGMPQCLC